MKVQGTNVQKDSFTNGAALIIQPQNINNQPVSNSGFNSTNPFISVSGKQQPPKKDVNVNALWGNFGVSQKPSQQNNVFSSTSSSSKSSNFF